MSIQVETKDCTSISDAELAEMADLCAEREPRFDIGFLSKQREEWVLVTRAREGTKLRGYSFSTLERIGGTPSLLIGLATVDRTSRADTVLRAMMGDKYRRALLAFPDEDVLVGTRLLGPDGFKAFAGLTDVVPAPGQQGHRRGAGLGPAPGQALRRRRPHRRPHLRGHGRRTARPAGSTSSAPSPSPAPRICAFFEPVDVRRRRPPGHLRVGHGRGPGRRQARRTLSTGHRRPGAGGRRRRGPRPGRPRQ